MTAVRLTQRKADPAALQHRRNPAYQSQSVEIDGNTFESVADGTFYAGDKTKKDGFYLRLKITNNGDKPLKFTGFSVKAAQGELRSRRRDLPLQQGRRA